MKAAFIFCIVVLFSLIPIQAQPDFTITAYPVNDELTQNTVTCIIQDHKGVLWLSTWDGLNKFDGYNFQNYKAHPGKNVSLTNNRILHLAEDNSGFIWAVCYDGNISRFNPETETFEQIQTPPEFTANSVTLLGNNHVLIQDKNNRVVRMTVDTLTRKTSMDFHFQCKGNPSSERIILYDDAAGNEWILASESGLYQSKPGENGVRQIRGSEQQGFYAVYENYSEVLFGSDNGEVWHYNKQKKQFSIHRINATSKVKYIKQAGIQTVYATSLDGFFIQKTGQEPVHFPIPHSNPQTKGIRNAYLDRNNLLWIETNAPELVLFDLPTQTFRFIPFKSVIRGSREAYNLQVIEDHTGNEWIYPYYGGLAYYKNKQIIPFVELNKELSWNASDNHYRFFSDEQNNLWVSTSRWLGKISPRNPLFHKTVFDKKYPNKPEDNTFRTLMQDEKGNLWVGNKTGEILLYNSECHFIGKLTPDGKITSDPQQNTYVGNAYSIKQDHKGRIWIGTKGQGLLCATPNGEHTYQIQTFRKDSKNPYSISSDNLYDIYEDSQNRIWIGGYEGGLNYIDESHPSGLRFINYYNDLKNYPIQEADKVYCVTSDKKGHIWVGTSNGIIVFDENFRQPDEIKFNLHQRVAGNPHSLSSNNVQNIYCASNDTMYIATFGGGLCQAYEDSNGSIFFKSYTVEDGLQSDIIFSIQEDTQQNLWLASGSGLSRFNLLTKKTEKWDEQQIGFPPLFNEGEALYSSKGEIVFLTLAGLFHFNPNRITKSDYTPTIIFTQLMLGGKVMEPQEGSILPKNLEYMERIEIPHDENYFTLRYAALEMTHPTSVSYAYKLEGFDKEWKEAGNQRAVTYTNLPTGTYRFSVRSTNGDGVWVNNVRTLEIEILPSFWETPLAWLLYFIALILTGYIAMRLISTFYNLRNKVYIEQQLTDIKLRFFTDISHDLRTPLTLITAPLENLLENKKLPAFAKEQLTLMKRNTDQMLKLVNQILDFRKLQSHKMKLTIEQIEVVSFISRIMVDFKHLAQEQHILFTFTHSIPECYLWADADKLEKILFNLLSNAFKFTESGKQIEIYLEKDEKNLYIEVKDEGIGIPQNKQKDIFTRFGSLHSSSILGVPSTGIGLSIVKELVELHGGSISLTSKEGEGSCFKLSFQLGRSHYGPDTEFVLQDSHPETEDTEEVSTTEENTVSAEQEADTSNAPCVLLVEDNRDMRSFLRCIFEDEYQILEASDGQAGLEMAKKYVPEIIISDVMMPVMDGMQLVTRLKSELQTSHIPIILLTAKSAIESKLDAMKEGADDYITKPFSAAYLKARTENLLMQRKKLQALYCQSLLAVNPNKNEQKEAEEFLSEQDHKFMDKLLQLMEQQIGNGELTVDMLVKNFYMSRSSFFAKLKTLTGLSPIEFIQQMRVKRAAQLIEEDQYSMSEIATMVGINDPHYFSRYFKKAYSMTPTEYKKKVLSQK